MTDASEARKEGLTPIERVRMALAMRDAGYWNAMPDIEDIEGLLRAYDDKAAPVSRSAGETTDEQCRVAIAATKPDRIQGFSYGRGFTAPHVVRDVWLPSDRQELWRGNSHEEMMERVEIEKMRLALLAAARLESLTAPPREEVGRP